MAVFWGSNLLHYTIHEPGMSHAYSFFLVSSLVWLTPKLYESPHPHLKWTLLAGLAAGLMVLIRPTNILIMLYPALYGVSTWADFKARLHFFRSHPGRIWPAVAVAAAVWLPQMACWKYISGEWFMYSYGDEGFIYWKRARMAQVLFDIKNGWLLFSPLMGISLLGLLAGLRHNRLGERWIAIIWLASWYLFASWWAWWFGGAFGHRSFIDLYPLLALPFAGVAHFVFRSRNKVRFTSFVVLVVLLTYYSLGLTDHFFGPHYEWYSWKAAMQKMFGLPF